MECQDRHGKLQSPNYVILLSTHKMMSVQSKNPRYRRSERYGINRDDPSHAISFTLDCRLSHALFHSVWLLSVSCANCLTCCPIHIELLSLSCSFIHIGLQAVLCVVSFTWIAIHVMWCFTDVELISNPHAVYFTFDCLLLMWSFFHVELLPSHVYFIYVGLLLSHEQFHSLELLSRSWAVPSTLDWYTFHVLSNSYWVDVHRICCFFHVELLRSHVHLIHVGLPSYEQFHSHELLSMSYAASSTLDWFHLTCCLIHVELHSFHMLFPSHWIAFV